MGLAYGADPGLELLRPDSSVIMGRRNLMNAVRAEDAAPLRPFGKPVSCELWDAAEQTFGEEGTTPLKWPGFVVVNKQAMSLFSTLNLLLNHLGDRDVYQRVKDAGASLPLTATISADAL
ncbi:hypothetical protein MRX96_025395 [Rhipicephalus microplus]